MGVLYLKQRRLRSGKAAYSLYVAIADFACMHGYCVHGGVALSSLVLAHPHDMLAESTLTCLFPNSHSSSFLKLFHPLPRKDPILISLHICCTLKTCKLCYLVEEVGLNSYFLPCPPPPPPFVGGMGVFFNKG